MQIRYLGFDQLQNSRVYRFEVRTEEGPATEASVVADLALFRLHSVAIQEGPSLCGAKLTADLQRGWEGEHELTASDIGAHAHAKVLADSQRAASRKPYRRTPAQTSGQTEKPPKPWSRFGLG